MLNEREKGWAYSVAERNNYEKFLLTLKELLRNNYVSKYMAIQLA